MGSAWGQGGTRPLAIGVERRWVRAQERPLDGAGVKSVGNAGVRCGESKAGPLCGRGGATCGVRVGASRVGRAAWRRQRLLRRVLRLLPGCCWCWQARKRRLLCLAHGAQPGQTAVAAGCCSPLSAVAAGSCACEPVHRPHGCCSPPVAAVAGTAAPVAAVAPATATGSAAGPERATCPAAAAATSLGSDAVRKVSQRSGSFRQRSPRQGSSQHWRASRAPRLGCCGVQVRMAFRI